MILVKSSKPEIRLARSDDTDSLMDLLRQYHNESGHGRFSEGKAKHAIEVGLARQEGMIGVIRGRSGLEASIGLFLTVPAFSLDAVLTDLWMIVDEDFRRSQNAKELLAFAKFAAVELGRPLMMSAVANEKTTRKVELMERQLPKSGSLFFYDPSAAA